MASGLPPPPPPPPPASPPGPVIIQVQPSPPPKVLTKCSHCGSVFDLTLGRCNRCGAPVLGPEGPAPPAETKKAWKIPRWVYVAAIVVVIAIVAGSILWYEYGPGGPQNPYKVKITEVDWLIDSQPYTTYGPFTLKGGSTAELSLGLWCPPVSGFFGITSQTCSSGSVTIETPGFSLSNTNAPFTWSSGNSGQVATVYVWVTFPNHSYSGTLVINLE